MGVSTQRHAPAALCPGERTPVPIVQEAGWASEPVWTQRLEEKILFLCRGWNPDLPVVQSIVRHYTDWVTSGSIKGRIFLDQLNHCQLLKMPQLHGLSLHSCVLYCAVFWDTCNVHNKRHNVTMSVAESSSLPCKLKIYWCRKSNSYSSFQKVWVWFRTDIV
jgi:hypothetical protein